jgi:hypothetical protein
MVEKDVICSILDRLNIPFIDKTKQNTIEIYGCYWVSYSANGYIIDTDGFLWNEGGEIR